MTVYSSFLIITMDLMLAFLMFVYLQPFNWCEVQSRESVCRHLTVRCRSFFIFFILEFFLFCMSGSAPWWQVSVATITCLSVLVFCICNIIDEACWCNSNWRAHINSDLVTTRHGDRTILQTQIEIHDNICSFSCSNSCKNGGVLHQSQMYYTPPSSSTSTLWLSLSI